MNKEQQLKEIFEPICKEASNFSEAFDRAIKMRGLPEGLAFYFWKNYGQGGMFTLKRAFYLLYVKLDGKTNEEKFPS